MIVKVNGRKVDSDRQMLSPSKFIEPVSEAPTRFTLTLLDLSIDLQLELFDATVLSIMLYACEACGADSYKIMKTLHLKVFKHILYVKPSTCNNIVYGELGRYPVESIVQKRMIAYWRGFKKR